MDVAPPGNQQHSGTVSITSVVRPSVVFRVFLALALGLCAFAAFAQRRAFGVVDAAMQLRASMTVAEQRALVEARVADRTLDTPDDHLLTAELLKQLGDPRAPAYYEAAIAAAPNQPAYELFYADYLRNYRGPWRPLFRDAADHYYAALEKLLAGERRDSVIADRIDHGLVALYQEDGLPLVWRGRRPELFFSSVERAAHSMADLDEVHDTRDFTAEALFASSGARLGRPLTLEELRAIARVKRPRATFDRLRLRRGGGALDFFYEGRLIGDGRITNFFDPGRYADVALRTYGAAIEYTTASHAPLDLNWRLAYSHAHREGVIEFAPSQREIIDQVDVRLAGARFVGPDKVHAELSASAQNLEPEHSADPSRHARRIAALTGEYLFVRPLPFLGNSYGLFATRGVHFRGGVVLDDEWFGSVRVGRRDVYAGVEADGLGPLDVTVQPGIIRASVSADPLQTQQHRRLDANVVVRLIDEERQPGIPSLRFLGLYPAFVHLVFPYKRDVATEGLRAFENQRVGAGLVVKMFRRALPETLSRSEPVRVHPTTILVSARYDRQWFPRLDKSENLYSVSIGFGY